VRKRYEALVIVALLSVAAWTRLYRLASESVWLDEAATFLRSSLPIPDLIDNSVKRMHNPSYFLFMHYWLQLGDDETMLRLPSVVFGVLLVGAAYALGRIVGGVSVGALTALFVIVAPLHLRYAQEARMYSLFVLGTTLGLCGLFMLIDNPQRSATWPLARGQTNGGAARIAWTCLVLGMLMALYSHNTGVFFVAGCWLVAALHWLRNREQRGAWLRNWLVANVLVLLAWSPWLTSLFDQTKRISKSFWAPEPTWDLVEQTLSELYLMTTNNVVLQGTLAAMALLGLWAARKRPALLALLVLALTPPLLVLLVSLKRPIFISRIMLWGTVPFFVIVALGVRALRPRWLAAAVAIGVVGLAGYDLKDSYYGKQRKPDWRRMILEVDHGQTPDSVVLAIGGREKRQLRYYHRRKSHPLPELDWKWTEPHKLDQRIEGKRWAWIITRTNLPNSKAVLRMMKRRGRLEWQRNYGRGLRVKKYRINKKFRSPPG
jgi:hypothetical protein